LVGLPAFFGGVIYMNAGIGGRTDSLFTIGEFVESVRAWDLTEKKLVEFSKEQCGFVHRKSVFHDHPYVILGAVIQCMERSLEESKQRKADRLQFCKENFEYGNGCFGSCFSRANRRILKAVSLFCKVVKLGRGRVTFAEHEANWLVNRGAGRYQDAIRIIRFCQWAHRLVHREIRCEVILWE
jgi:UDP-N-acetylenolpyruvoylglucosamine reductase